MIPALQYVQDFEPVLLAKLPGEHFSHFVLLVALEIKYNMKKINTNIYCQKALKRAANTKVEQTYRRLLGC